jgi:hypothetical protein
MSACSMGAAADAGLAEPGANVPSGSATGGSGGTSNAATTPPEQENEASYSAPVVSGHWIWTANPDSGKVALIDASNLRVTTADAGLSPTYVAALGESNDTDSAAIVLNVGDDTASVLHASSGNVDVETVHVHHEANRMTVSPSGRWALVWSDATLLQNPDPTDGLQDITVLDLGVKPAVPYPLTVGYRPSRVSFGTGEHAAYFVADSVVSVVDLPDTDPPDVARDVPVATTPGESATVRDVTVTPDGKFAVIRHDGSATVSMISLADGSETDVTLRGPVTDIDLSPDGKVALAVVRSMPATTSGGSGGSSGSAGHAGGSTAATTGGTSSATGGTGGTNASSTGGTNASGASAGGASGGMTNASGADGGQSGASDAPGGAENGGQSAGGAPEAGAPGATGAEPGGAPGVSSTGGTGATGGSTATGGTGGTPAQATPSYVTALPLARIQKDATAFDEIAIDDDVGSIVIAPAGNLALLYTNATPSDHVVILDTKALAVTRTVVVESPVKAVLASPDGLNAVALLAQATGSQRAGGFSLIPLTTSLPPKIQGTDAPPQSVALGENQALITVEGTDPVKNVPVHAVYLAELPGFHTTAVSLASPPLSAGLIPEVNLGFVAQSHPEGRITFLHLDTAQPQTLTGFELAARVVQGD